MSPDRPSNRVTNEIMLPYKAHDHYCMLYDILFLFVNHMVQCFYCSNNILSLRVNNQTIMAVIKIRL